MNKEETIRKIMQIDNKEELLEFFKDNNINIEGEEFELFANKINKIGEEDEDFLDNISGGGYLLAP